MASSVFLILLACALYGLIHSLLASHGAKRFAEARWGRAARRWYRLGFSLLGGLMLLPIFWLAWRLPDRVLYVIPFPWSLLTGLAQGAAGIALLAGVMQTGALGFIGLHQALDRQGSAPLIAGRGADELVINGLYRWVRHPLYTCGLVILWLVPVMSWNLLVLSVGLTAYILIGIVFEERKLLAEFGEAYAEYKKRTPALIPRMRMFHREDSKDAKGS